MLTLNEEKNKVVLEIDGKIKEEFIAKMENLELLIFPRSVELSTCYLILLMKISVIIFSILLYYLIVEFRLRNFKKSNVKYIFEFRCFSIFAIICLALYLFADKYQDYLISIILGIPGSIVVAGILRHFNDHEETNE